jgi:hypothetical protein
VIQITDLTIALVCANLLFAIGCMGMTVYLIRWRRRLVALNQALAQQNREIECFLQSAPERIKLGKQAIEELNHLYQRQLRNLVRLRRFRFLLGITTKIVRKNL